MVSDILSDAGFETVLTAATVKEAIITAEKENSRLDGFGCHAARWGRLFPDASSSALLQMCQSSFLTAKDEAADKLAGLGAWSRRLYFKAVYAAGAITACLCGFAPNL